MIGAVPTAEVGKAAGATNVFQEFGVAVAAATFASVGRYATQQWFPDGFRLTMGSVGCVAQIVATDPTPFPDSAKLGHRFAFGIAVTGVLVGFAELAALPPSRRGTSHLGSPSVLRPGSGEEVIFRAGALDGKGLFPPEAGWVWASDARDQAMMNGS